MIFDPKWALSHWRCLSRGRLTRDEDEIKEFIAAGRVGSSDGRDDIWVNLTLEIMVRIREIPIAGPTIQVSEIW